MICNNCGNNINSGALSCPRCGAPVYQQQQQQANQYQQNPNQHWGQQPNPFNTPPPGAPSQDMGFLLLALLSIGYILFGFLLDMAGFGWEISRIFYLLLFIAEFVIMIIFTRNTSYRTIIIVLGAMVFLYRVWEYFLR